MWEWTGVVVMEVMRLGSDFKLTAAIGVAAGRGVFRASDDLRRSSRSPKLEYVNKRERNDHPIRSASMNERR